MALADFMPDERPLITSVFSLYFNRRAFDAFGGDIAFATV